MLIHACRVTDEAELLLVAVLVARDLAVLCAFVTLFACLPARLLPLLSAFTAPLLVVSYASQCATNARRRSTGQLSPGTVLLRLFGSLTRFTTTITQLGGELPVLVNHAIGCGGCTTLLAQIWWFRRARAPEPAPSGGAGTVATTLALGGSRAMSFRSATLMWRSLGGFDADEKKRPSPAQMRAAFDALDADGSGTITLENVAELLAASNPGRVSVENAQQLIAYADVDGSGSIDFDEFCRMIRLAGIIVQLKPREP